MKSKITIFLSILIYILKANLLIADDLNIKSKKIKIDEKKGITIFQNQVSRAKTFKTHPNDSSFFISIIFTSEDFIMKKFLFSF